MKAARQCRRAVAATSLSLLLVCLVLALAVPGAAAWTDCSIGPSIFKVSDVTLDPSPVQPGDTANFLITAHSGQDVPPGGTVQMTVHLMGFPIWTQVDNICDKATCPIKKGAVEVRYTQPFPEITPPGAYSVTLAGHSGDDALFCVTLDFQVVPPEAAQVAQRWAASLKGQALQHVLTTHRKSLQ